MAFMGLCIIVAFVAFVVGMIIRVVQTSQSLLGLIGGLLLVALIVACGSIVVPVLIVAVVGLGGKKG